MLRCPSPWSILILLSYPHLQGGTANAQQSIPLSVEDVLTARSFTQLQRVVFSPDGKQLAYSSVDLRRFAPKYGEGYFRTGVGTGSGADIFIANTDSGETRNLTNGQGSNELPVWSPDGRYLAFSSDRDGSGHACLWVWETNTNTLRKVSDIRVAGDNPGSIQWLPNSRELLVSTIPDKLAAPPSSAAQPAPLSGADGAGLEQPAVPGSRVILYRSDPISSKEGAAPKSDPWDLDLFSHDIVLIGVTDGKVRSIDRGHRMISYFLSPDGTRIAYASPKRFESPGSQQQVFDCVAITLATGTARVVASDMRLDFNAQLNWSPDSSYLIFFTIDAAKARKDVNIVNANDAKAKQIAYSPFLATPGIPSYETGPLWDSGGQRVYFLRGGGLWQVSLDGTEASVAARVEGYLITGLVTRGSNELWSPDDRGSLVAWVFDEQTKQPAFYRLDLRSRASTRLPDTGKCVSCTNQTQLVAVAPGGQRLAFFSGDAQHDTDLWIVDSSFRNKKRLTHNNPQFDKYRMGAPQIIEWRDLDGNVLHGGLILPSDFQKGKRYPLIVIVYGGRFPSNVLDRYELESIAPFNVQLLATRGYAVLLPDAPQHLGTPMADLAKTVLPGVDKVIEMGMADPDRLGVMGHSYGGYSTLALIVQTKRFKAAVDASGVGDLVAAYGEMDKDGSAFGVSHGESHQFLTGGPPWEYPQRYVQNSPIFYLDRVETPLLIVHGGEDNTYRSFLADEVFVGLRRLGKEVVYAKYEGESHAPDDWSYEDKLDYANRVIQWFDEHLKRGRNGSQP